MRTPGGKLQNSGTMASLFSGKMSFSDSQGGEKTMGKVCNRVKMAGGSERGTGRCVTGPNGAGMCGLRRQRPPAACSSSGLAGVGTDVGRAGRRP